MEEQLPDPPQKQLVLDEQDGLLLFRQILQGAEDLFNSLAQQGLTALLSDRRASRFGRFPSCQLTDDWSQAHVIVD